MSRLIFVLALCLIGAVFWWLSQGLWPELATWALAQQRAFQTEIAAAVRALQSGSAAGWAALIVATGGYGLVHAAGPGHGKYLIGGAGLASGAPMALMLGLAVTSSLLQSIWAIVLVYGGFALLELGAAQVTGLAETVLAPASYLAIAGIGLVFVARGCRALWLLRGAQTGHAHAHGHDHGSGHAHDHGHDHACCGHAHGPSAEQVAALTSWRQAAVLVASIAVRPCTGAIFLLVIAWQLDLLWAGIVGVLAMGLGTATLTSGVAASSVVLRGLALRGGKHANALAVAAPSLQLAAGLLIFWASFGIFWVSLG